MIEPIPDFKKDYPELVNSIKKQNFNVFLGNGIYRNDGGKSWKDFVLAIIEDCQNSGILKNYSDYISIKRELTDIDRLPDIIQTCKDLIFEKFDRNDPYYSIIRKYLPESKKYNVINSILELEPFSIATTNIDCTFQDWYKYDSLTIKDTPINGNSFYQVHGCINDFNSIVISRDEYNKYYSNGACIRDFYTEWLDKTTLFIGYGLNEITLNLILYGIKQIIKSNLAYIT